MRIVTFLKDVPANNPDAFSNKHKQDAYWHKYLNLLFANKSKRISYFLLSNVTRLQLEKNVSEIRRNILFIVSNSIFECANVQLSQLATVRHWTVDATRFDSGSMPYSVL